jgi:hypothetical protein
MGQSETKARSKKKIEQKRASGSLKVAFCHTVTIPQKPQQNRTFWENGYGRTNLKTKCLGAAFRAFCPEALLWHKLI